MTAIILTRQQYFCAVVVQQDPPVRVADNHPFRQLRHNGRQDIFLFLRLGPGTIHPTLDII